PILTAGKHTVLDVGRTHRLATPHQRKAVVNRQDGTCAGPGCHGPVVHVHHIEYWSDGGPTDLANLIGLCPRCHAAVHQGFFTIDPDTHQTHRTLRTRRTNARRTRAG
ncbi:HNH endonuclease signature motif containing protein, partial [Aeromicrobium sp. REDSEA-S38_B2]|uniref:HNH endonuclease n=1 Tax=Aeromicrobium sp. REDSEA-S38_B2 TaxID=1811528 RepID=UPI000AB1A1D7